MASRRNIQYSRLPTYEDEDCDSSSAKIDSRFEYSPKSYDRVPWKSIALALFLLLLGCLLLLLSFFIFTGHMGGELSQAYGLLGLGFLTFLPGMLNFIIVNMLIDCLISFYMVFMKLGLHITLGGELKDTVLPQSLIS